MERELVVIDSGYLRPRFAAVFARVERGEIALLESGTAHSRDRILSSLAERGLKAGAVRYVIVTHAHLDHAGGAAALLEALPQARLVAHPRAARHLVDPSKLEASARAVYGDAEFERLYGSLRPVAPERVLSPGDGESLELGGAKLGFLHTRGHAKHHFCVLDPGLEAIFTGDAFGLRYPELQREGLFIFPTTSPTDFEGEEALAALARIAESGARRAFLTHFGEEDRLVEAAAQLRGHIEFSMKISEEARALAPEGRPAFLLARLRERYAQAIAEGPPGFLDLDLRLNADGLAWALGR